ncbi:SDR family NAD(P)-dependent oxidoreductase [Roseiarcaceae bacterium H3SJ34-1]|uniref:SDR family NAD(P)-dependent oxidoreductase n=1 Tax=Terripilifer ovatus TaxID=3032367 RepID=UPI003AB95122|nr:SDR family NAD(P)-dependent oxidoreductase [Roseiarcaceae bacterium H3SJ34-1]
MTADTRNGFAGRTTVLSGAGGGIGMEMSKRILADGGTLVAVDRNEEALQRLEGVLGKQDRLITRAVDVSDEAACATLAEFVKARCGRLDVLINNAGFFPVHKFEELTYAQWRDVMAINLDSVFLMTKSLLPLIKPIGRGRIVNIGSSSVFNAPAFHPDYVAAKSGVIGLSRCMANEFGKYGITVNVVSPGLTDTPGTRNVFGLEAVAARAATRPLGRTQVAHDVIGTIAFLVSDDAAFVTGQMINVDGGAIFH